MFSRTRCVLLGALLLTAPLAASAQEPVSPPPAPACRPDLALVLSGGGAKGLAHIGVMEVLDSLGFRPDLVVGTSAGALIGAMYASGLTGRQIEALVRTLPLAELFSGGAAWTSRLGAVVEPVQRLNPLLVWERRERSLQLRSVAVEEQDADALLTRTLLRGDLEAGGDFDRLPIRFRAVATDLANRQAVVLAGGDLARAIRASIAIPGVFAPVPLDGRLLVDGGLAQNVPLGPARALGARRLIVSDVSARPGERVQSGSPVAVLDQLLDLVLQQPDDSLRPGDVRVRPRTAGVGFLDFSHGAMDRLLAAGRAAAIRALSGMPPAAGPACPGSGPPGPLPDPAELARITARLQALDALGTYQAVWLDPRWVGDSLVIQPLAQLAPEGTVSAGFGYDNQYGGHAWVSAENLGLLGGWARVGALAYLGQIRQLVQLRTAGLRARRPVARGQDEELLPDPRTGRRPWGELPGLTVRPAAAIHAMQQDLRHFDGEGTQTGTTVFRDALAFVGAEVATSRGWYAAAGPVAQWWQGRDSTWSLPPAASRAVGGMARIGWAGKPREAAGLPGLADGVAADALYLDAYQRLLLTGAVPARIGTVTLRARAEAGWGARLPAGETFLLGGGDGFPGLHPDERRGDRVLSVGLTASRWIEGPLYALVELASGSATRGGTVLPTRGWGTGASAGVAVSTPFGSASIAYGVATFGRGTLVVKLGEP